ncbi:Zinc finger C2H2-type, partial [Trinorchestia longiramus]
SRMLGIPPSLNPGASLPLPNRSPSRSFPSPSMSLRDSTHMEENSANRVTCPYCVKSFKWPCLLQRHLRIHTGERPFRCPFCTYAAAQKFDVTKHIMTRHSDANPTNMSSMNDS